MTNEEMKAGRFLQWAKARKRFAWVMEQLNNGKTVQLTTYTTARRYTAKHAEMFKVTKTGLYVQQGKKYECLNFSKLTAY